MEAASWILIGALLVASQYLAVEAAQSWHRARARHRLARQRSPEHCLAHVTEHAVAAMIHEARAAFERAQQKR